MFILYYHSFWSLFQGFKLGLKFAKIRFYPEISYQAIDWNSASWTNKEIGDKIYQNLGKIGARDH